MGKTSTAIKNQWNKEHYTQIKICTPPEIAAVFKNVCKANNVSMSGELINFMMTRSNVSTVSKPQKELLSTKAGRRKTLYSIVQQLEQVRDAEAQYRDNIPVNLQNSERYETAEEWISGIEEAIDALKMIEE